MIVLLCGMTDLKRSGEQRDKRRPYCLRHQSVCGSFHVQICVIKQWFFERGLPKSGQQINSRNAIVRSPFFQHRLRPLEIKETGVLGASRQKLLPKLRVNLDTVR